MNEEIKPEEVIAPATKSPDVASSCRLYALRSFRADPKNSEEFIDDGYLLFPNSLAANNFLKMASAASRNNRFSHYEDFGPVVASDFVYKKVQTNNSFFVRKIEDLAVINSDDQSSTNN